MNLGFLGKGNCGTAAPLREQILAGAIGLKLHEDWGTTPAAIDVCLAWPMSSMCRSPSTPTRSTSRVSWTTPSAPSRAAPSTRFTPKVPAAARARHHPGMRRGQRAAVVHQPHAAVHGHTIDEHLDMLMVCHHLDAKIPEDVGSPSRASRPETIAAEDCLHDLGAISNDVVRFPGHGADRRGHHPDLADGPQDEAAVRPVDRPIAPGRRQFSRPPLSRQITPSILPSHMAFAHVVGSVEVGKLADLVVFKPALFGVKPETVLKGGFIAWANMGDPNASIPTPQPTFYRPQFGAAGRALGRTCLTFVSEASLRSKTGPGSSASPAD